MPSDLLTVHEAAEFFGVSPQTVRRWTRDGKLAVARLPSGRPRYLLADLERVIRSSEAAA